MAAFLGIFFTLIFCAVQPAQAQENGFSIIADELILDTEGRLTASGHVSVFYNQIRLTAPKIIYDREKDTVQIAGPFSYTDGDGSILMGDAADLSADFKRGLLKGVRFLIDERLQIAAKQAERTDSFTYVSNVVASSCKICNAQQTPLWEMRAQNMVHDKDNARLYYYNAHFRFLGIPLLYTPYLSAAEARVKRAPGFLAPELRSSTKLGSGIKLPYFIPLTPYSDLRITPYIAQRSKTLGFDFRQRLQGGDINIEGALSKDTSTRHFTHINGRYAVMEDTELSFDATKASDYSYLEDYALNARRYRFNRFAITQLRGDSYAHARFLENAALRSPTYASKEVTQWGRLSYHRRGTEPLLNGATTGFFYAEQSSENGAGIALARAYAGWQRSAVLGYGLMGTISAGTQLSHNTTQTKLHADIAAELRWPIARHSAGGTDIITPFAQFVPTRRETKADLGIYSALAPEFDEVNILSIAPSAGASPLLIGGNTNIGLQYRHINAKNWDAALAISRLYRTKAAHVFTQSSGLSGRRSDLLIGLALGSPQVLRHRLTYSARAAMSPQGAFTRTENRIGLRHPIYDISGGYVHIAKDLGLSRGALSLAQTGVTFRQPRYSLGAVHNWILTQNLSNTATASSDITLNADYTINAWWRAKAGYRYDLKTKKTILISGSAIFSSDCLSADFSLSHRLQASGSFLKGTDIAFNLNLVGFGAQSNGVAARRCRP